MAWDDLDEHLAEAFGDCRLGDAERGRKGWEHGFREVRAGSWLHVSQEDKPAPLPRLQVANAAYQRARRARLKAEAPPPPQRTCECGCGAVLPPSRTKPRRYASERCREKVRSAQRRAA